MASLVKIAALGGLSVTRPGGALPSAAAQRRRLAVLVYIAAAGPVGVTRDRLAAVFWPERDTDSARNLLNQTLSALRQLAPSFLTVGPAGEVALDSAQLDFDVAAFEQKLAARSWEEASALYGGSFLDGFGVPGALEFERWAEQERARLSFLYSDALESLAADASACGDTERAVHWARMRAAHSPASGSATRALLRALVAAGDRAAALDHARIHQRLLRETLDLALDPETDAFVQSLSKPSEPDMLVLLPPNTPAQERVSGHSSRAGEGPPTAEGEATPGRHSQFDTVSSGGDNGIAIGEPTPRSRRASHLRWTVASLLGVIAVASALYARGVRREAPTERRIGAILSEQIPSQVVAVLPFRNLAQDSSEQYFSDGLADDVIARLAPLRDLRIVPFTSVAPYRNSDPSMDELRQRFGATAVLEGGVRRDRDRLRVAIRLIDTRTRALLWSEAFDREASDVLTIQGEIATRIANALEVQLTTDVSARLRAGATASATAFDFYLRGLECSRKAESPGVRMLEHVVMQLDSAETFYRQALAIDARHAPSAAGLAFVALGRSSLDRGDGWLDSAFVYSREAVRWDPSYAFGHVVLAVTHYFSNDWREARTSYLAALRLAPNDPEVLRYIPPSGTGHVEDDVAIGERLLAMEGDREANYQLAFAYMIIDDTASMRAVDDKAKALFPSSQGTAWGYHARRALVHVYRGDSLAARREVAAFAKGAELPHESLMLAGAIELALGSLESARAYLDSAGVFYGNDSTLVYKTEPEELIEGWYRLTSLAFIFGKRGQHEQARELLAQQARYDSATLARLWMDDGVRYDLGVVTLLQGDRDGAVRHIARAIEEGYTLHRWIAFDPRLEALHDDPRFAKLVARAKWRADSLRALLNANRRR